MFPRVICLCLEQMPCEGQSYDQRMILPHDFSNQELHQITYSIPLLKYFNPKGWQ